MAYAVPPPPKTRPSAVDTASTLLWVVVATQVISLIVLLLPNDELSAALDQFERDHPDFEGAGGTITLIAGLVGVGLTTLIAVGLGVLAVFLRRGSQGARITTWVLGGLLALCSVCGLAGTALSSSMTGTSDNADANELSRIIEENTPAWQATVSLIVNLVTLGALIAAIVLLALPVSNDYFRKEQQVWVPPTTFPGGGGYGQTPPPAPPSGPPPPPQQ